jgi:hypothetical protein
VAISIWVPNLLRGMAQQLSGEAARMSLQELIVNENRISTRCDQQIEDQREISEWLCKRGMQLRKEGELSGSHLAPRRSRSGEKTKA